MNTIPPSELLINNDGSIFHLHMLPEQLADKIILVGDPGRVELIAQYLEDIESRCQNREFHSLTGHYKNKRITVVSTGIGCDNIDIVLNELDALPNIDFNQRCVKSQLRQLEIVRIGTCGGLQEYTPEGSFIASQMSIGFDGLLNFYGRRDEVCDTQAEKEFLSHMQWKDAQCIAHPYVVNADEELLQRIAETDMVKGITVSCGGFYGPQGRQLRIPLADPLQNKKIETYIYQGLHITNFEMESSAVAGLSKLLGHKAMTCCMVIANRIAGKAMVDYQQRMHDLIQTVLERI